MDKHRARRWAYLLLLMCVCFGAGVVLSAGMRLSYPLERTFEPDMHSVGNPLMGYAPRAAKETVRDDVQLLYVDITWREWEPEKGQFAVDDVVEKHQLDRWRAEGKHIVLRFVCDYPEDESDRDIPDWLYEETGEQGEWYDIDYGKGFAPDYNHELFIAYHAQAVAALGEAFGQDGFVSYIELGSLGHWGEWHVDYSAGIQRMPKADVREKYITPWIEAFPNAKIMMRRPFAAAKTYGFGLFNDMAGELKSTQTWLEWIEVGGDYDQAQEKNALVPMKDFWISAPSGGELTSSVSMQQMLETDIEQTIDLTRRSHTTFLGPKTADAAYEAGYEALLQNMGYRLWVKEAALRPGFGKTTLEMTWTNSGVAPMYWDWPVYAYVWDTKGNVIERAEIDLRLSEVAPDKEVRCSVPLRTKGLYFGLKDYYIGVGIVDPMTGENAVRLDMKTVHLDRAAVLFK